MIDRLDLGIAGIEDAELVAAGGFGRVYRARQPELDRWVAVKVLRLLDDNTVRRFDRERRTMGRLSDHPGIVTIYQSGLTDRGEPYLVMPFLEAGSLQDRLDRTGPLELTEAVELMTKVADAVSSAHDQGVIHRDLKPANIVLAASGEPLVTDFGIASLVGTEASRTVGSLTPAFGPPEILKGDPVSQAADIYGLGATLYALIGGAPPFGSADSPGGMAEMLRRIDEDPVPDLRPLDTPDAVCAVIESALAKDPAHRQVDAAEFARQLRAAHDDAAVPEAGGSDVTLTAPSLRGRRSRAAKPRRAAGLVAGIGILVIVAGTAIAVRSALNRSDDSSTSTQGVEDASGIESSTTALTTTPTTSSPTTSTSVLDSTALVTTVAMPAPVRWEPFWPVPLVSAGGDSWYIRNSFGRDPSMVDRIDLETLTYAGSLALDGKAVVDWIFDSGDDVWLVTKTWVDEYRDSIGVLLQVDATTLDIIDRVPLPPPDVSYPNCLRVHTGSVLAEPFFGPGGYVWLVHASGIWIFDAQAGEIIDEIVVEAEEGFTRLLQPATAQGEGMHFNRKPEVALLGNSAFLTAQDFNASCSGWPLLLSVDLVSQSVTGQGLVDWIDLGLVPRVSEGGIWLGVRRYSPATLTVTDDLTSTVLAEPSGTFSLITEHGFGSIFALVAEAGLLQRIDPVTREVNGSVDFGVEPIGEPLFYGPWALADALWVEDLTGLSHPGTPIRIDPATLETTRFEGEQLGYWLGNRWWIPEGEGFEVVLAADRQ